MACQRAQEIDLPAFLAAPREEAFGDFRLHYPRCAQCAAEVRVWTELHESLAASHPDPEQLAGYEALSVQERSVVDRHVAGCPSCREELAQLADFDPARLAQPAAAPQHAREPGGGLREWLAGLGRIFWHPAFAYALVLLMVVPVVRQLARQEAEAPLAEQLFAEAPFEDAERPTPESAERRLAMPEPVSPLAKPSRSAPVPRPQSLAESDALARREAQPAKQRVAGKAGEPRQEKLQEKKDALVAGRVVREAIETESFAAEPSQPDAGGGPRGAELALRTSPPAPEIAANAPAPREADTDEGVEVAGASAESAEEVAFFSADESTTPDAKLEMEPMKARARAAFAPQAAAAAPHDLIRLEAWRTPRASPPDDLVEIRLSVPVPTELPPGQGQVRIRDADGGRELRERVDVPAAEGAERRVTVRVPRAWLAPGRYGVELERPGAPTAAFAFEIQ